MRDEVLVFGSLNMDLVVRVPRMPAAGETLTAHNFLANPGGKGANQAVACARQGARVAMAGRVGADGFGAQLRAALTQQGVDVAQVHIQPDASTGTAMILVDDAAQNCIAVVPGANACVGVGDAEALRERLQAAGMLLLQLEVPLPAVLRAAQLAHAVGCTVLLNPAPAQALPDALWQAIDVLVVNETEAQMLAGMTVADADSAAAAATRLAGRGPREVIVTLGERGVIWHSPGGTQHVPAVPVQAVDTTAAGDTFVGALAALRVQGESMQRALAHAVRAAALCVMRPGAQASMPTRLETDAFS